MRWRKTKAIKEYASQAWPQFLSESSGRMRAQKTCSEKKTKIYPVESTRSVFLNVF
jgi:hypothetical protein